MQKQNEKRVSGTYTEMSTIPGVAFSLEPVKNPVQGQLWDSKIEGGFPVTVRLDGDDAKRLTVTDARMRSISGGFKQVEIVNASGRWRVTVFETPEDMIEGNPEEGPRLHDTSKGHALYVVAAGRRETGDNNDPYRLEPFSMDERGVPALGLSANEVGDLTATRLATDAYGRLELAPSPGTLIAEYPAPDVNGSTWGVANFTEVSHYIYGRGEILADVNGNPLDVRAYSLLVATVEGGFAGDPGAKLVPFLKFTTSGQSAASVLKTLNTDPAQTFETGGSTGFMMAGPGLAGSEAWVLAQRFPFVHFGYTVVGRVDTAGANLSFRLWGYR